ncbi:class I fructose-bisphosphate aldolase [Deinococcus metalli]|uniref:2-amino-3,7-dideoxy-D-threo-hept-6-ulosonate synthase n=1 Tax=Deinococcus metalli TaxID=1141878 RepID=A0A7W8KCX8_9DEIO|nr:deoxyribose-phosphate aldolase [Deinococcus metalli]MBB5375864.1 class I fructose-bisphosphate aldolase [Deinococcus metalli]GHF36458.1 2-amino-3,7-dideoxy-D-threo-hept-6-ulosonate synthase [Deinococcus metalli]
MTVERVLPTDRAALIIPMDHGLTMGNLTGLHDPAALLERLIHAGVDGTLLSPGLAARLGGRCRAGHMSVTLTLDYQLWGDRPGTLEHISDVFAVCSVARARALGADAVKLLMPYGLGRRVTREVLTLAAQVADDARTHALPLMLEPLWMGEPLAPEEHDDVIVHGARVAVELGADILKIPAIGEAALTQVLAWGVPTVFLGGVKQDDPAALYGRIRRGIELGARGVVVGRNVWQSADMDVSIAALRDALAHVTPS